GRANAQTCNEVNWVAPTTTVPSARTGAAMVWDSFRSRLVVYGGQLSGGALSSGTWELDGTGWHLVTTNGSPGARAFHAMAYDSARHVVVLYGGRLASGTIGDTYEYDGTN